MKPIFRYSTSARWFKGNTHIHSQASDGGMALDAITQLYAQAGYDFLFSTDHWHASDNTSLHDHSPLLLLDGMELDGFDQYGSYYHVVCLGRFSGISREMGFEAALQAARGQGGMLILAHPYWTGNSFEEALRWKFDGVEVYNHVCHWLNGKSEGGVHWNVMLQASSNCLGFASDDAHLRPEHPGWNGGWIVVNAPECTQEAIPGAIRSGNYYSSCGPEFHTIQATGRKVEITTSPVQFVRLVGPGARGIQLGDFGTKRMSQASIQVPEDWEYAYLQIEDEQRRRAWTNDLFVTA